MIAAGMDVARFNFSHGNHEEKKEKIADIKAISEEMGVTVALLADTRGPEVRLGLFAGGKAQLTDGSSFTLTSDDIVGTAERASITYAGMIKDIRPGNRILLDDGLIELTVENCSKTDILTRVVNGGIIRDRKSVNVPGVSLNMPYISAQDRADLRFISENGFHFLAASFVRCEDDIRLLREELHRMNGDHLRIIAKIENAEGVRNTDAILKVSAGLMVARGDLGVELEFEDLPGIQKELIKKAYQAGKNVITATQMLESMVNNPRPTRAETSDVANAIYDGTSAIMLSAETSVGKFPVDAVRTMAKIAQRAENDIDYVERFQTTLYKPATSITNAISHATVTTAHDLDVKAILIVSKSGDTACNVSKFRPACPLIVGSPDPVVVHQMKLEWGVFPLLTREESKGIDIFMGAIGAAKNGGYIRNGDLVVITAGVPVGQSGTTNMLKVQEIGEERPVF
jgi:pyruvate kinase